jgi:hypothetical protein
MAGLILSPALANQEWGTLLWTTARNLADCSGINDLINDSTRLPPGGSAGLQAMGMSANDAGLHVAAFASIAALWRHSTNVTSAPMTDFWFSARQCMGTKPFPKTG